MTPHDAAKILELDPAAPPDQIEARFLELRTKLEEKIGKAPTPGLKEKYRDSLAEITTAFETLTLAADSSTLPVLKKQRTEVGERSTEIGGRRTEEGKSLSPLPPTENQKSKIENRKSGTEFLWVAIIAAVVLGAGGWWVLKTRAENEEKARLAAEAKAEAERQAQLAREQAERDRLAKEAAAKAEQERLEKLFTSLRGKLAELNVAYDAQMRAEQAAERELNELKSQARELAREQKAGPTPELRRANALLAAQDKFTAWLRDTLPSHPAKVAKARAEELLSARAADEAAGAVEAYAAALTQLKADLAAARAANIITGGVTLTANQEGVQWKFVDAFGIERRGTTPATLSDVALGEGEATFGLAPYPAIAKKVSVARDAPAAVSAEFIPARFTLQVTPAEARIFYDGAAHPNGTTFALTPAPHTFRIEAEGYAPRELMLAPRAGAELTRQIRLGQSQIDFLLEEIRTLARQARKQEANAQLTAAHHALAAAGDKEGTLAFGHEFNCHDCLFHQPHEWGWEVARLSIGGQITDSNLGAALWMLLGENPFAKGLPAQNFSMYWDTARQLCRMGRADLAVRWISLARYHGIKDWERGGLDAEEWVKVAAAAVEQGRLEIARTAFDEAMRKGASDNYDFDKFLKSSPQLWQAARDRAEPATLAALADFALAAGKETYNDKRYRKSERVLVDALHFFDWAEALVASGWAQRFQPYFDYILANNGTLEDPRAPAKPVPFAGPPGIPQLQAWLAAVAAKPSEIGGAFVQVGARVRARRALAAGQPELARKHASLPDNDYKSSNLWEDFARIADWDACAAAIRETYRDPSTARMSENTMAGHYGRAVAERVPDDQALAALRKIEGLAQRLTALAAYVVRRVEIEKFTEEQRAFLRQNPLI